MDQKLITITERNFALPTINTDDRDLAVSRPVPDSHDPTEALCASEPSHEAAPVVDSGLEVSCGTRTLSGMLVWTKKLCLEDTYNMYSRLGTVKMTSQKISVQMTDSGSKAKLPELHQYEDRMSFIFSPGSWLQYLGVNLELHIGLAQHSMAGWRSTINIYNLVPTEAPIFKLCARGDIPGVRHLLLSGKASVRDIDIWDYTPLQVSRYFVATLWIVFTDY